MNKHKDKSDKPVFAKIKGNRILDDQGNYLGRIGKFFIFLYSKRRKIHFALKREK